MQSLFRSIAILFLLGGAAPATLPEQIVRQLPRGYAVLGSASSSFGTPAHLFYIVAIGRPNETAFSPHAQARPLLIYERRSDGGYVLAGRNDHVVLRANQGGQCDPFEGGIAVKGPYFTVENFVACGSHWTDYVTFRFDARLKGFVFDNQRSQSWSFNPDTRPNAEALISDGVHVVRAKKGHPVRFADWRDPD